MKDVIELHGTQGITFIWHFNKQAKIDKIPIILSMLLQRNKITYLQTNHNTKISALD